MAKFQDVPDPLKPYLDPPPLYAKGDTQFWHDPHISAGMLSAHFDDDHDLASYRPQNIEKISSWIAASAELEPEAKILDLGCGPGRYTEKWARLGFQVTGIDLSPRSLETARASAVSQGLGITYVCEDYNDADLGGPFDLVTMISCDFGVLLPIARINLALKVAGALRPGGVFAFDVFSERHGETLDLSPDFRHLESGFWSPSPHYVLSQSWLFSTHQCKFSQDAVLTEDGRVRVFRRWEHLYSEDSLRHELATAGFEIVQIWADLMGNESSQESETIGVLARPSTRSDVLTFPRS